MAQGSIVAAIVRDAAGQLLKLGRPANSSRPFHVNESFLKEPVGVFDVTATAGNDGSMHQSGAVQVRFMAGSHKAGSTLVHWMTDSACKSLGLERRSDDAMVDSPGPREPSCMKVTTNFGGHSSHCANDKTALKACPDWNGDGHKHHFPSPSCCLFPPFPWEAPNVNFRAVFFLRDPIKLIVSHFWFHFDGHERPKPAEMYQGTRKGDLYVPQNITKGLLHEMSPSNNKGNGIHGYGRFAQMMGVLSELVHRNPPHMAKFTCLEDIMVDEDSVIGVWKAAFDFIGEYRYLSASMRSMPHFRFLTDTKQL